VFHWSWCWTAYVALHLKKSPLQMKINLIILSSLLEIVLKGQLLCTCHSVWITPCLSAHHEHKSKLPFIIMECKELWASIFFCSSLICLSYNYFIILWWQWNVINFPNALFMTCFHHHQLVNGMWRRETKLSPPWCHKYYSETLKWSTASVYHCSCSFS